MNISQNQSGTNFKGLYTPNNFHILERDLSKNPHITAEEVKHIKDSIIAYDALNRSIKQGKISANQIADSLYHKCGGMETDFNQDTFLAACVGFSANAMKKLGLVQPKNVSKRSMERGVIGACDVFDSNVTFNSNIDWANDIQDIMIKDRICNNGSSGHFLSAPIHEFMHNVHMKHLSRIQKEHRILPIINKNKDIRVKGINTEIKTPVKHMLTENVSDYATTNPMEAFAEYTSKVICKNLDMKNDLLPKDHTIQLELNNPMDKVIADFWNGLFKVRDVFSKN